MVVSINKLQRRSGRYYAKLPRNLAVRGEFNIANRAIELAMVTMKNRTPGTTPLKKLIVRRADGANRFGNQ